MLEVLRAVTAALKDNTNGVNAQLTAMALDTVGDYKPAQVKFIGSEVDDEVVAEGAEPAKLPAIYVTDGGPITMEGEVFTVNRDTQDGNGVVVDIRYLDAKSNDKKAAQGSFYVRRAIMRALKKWLDNNNAAMQDRNGIQIIACESVQLGRVTEKVGSAQVTIGATLQFKVRDTAP